MRSYVASLFHNPKNFAKTNKSNDYVKKCGNDAHYYDACRPSDGEDSPTGNDTDVQSNGKIEDDNASESVIGHGILAGSSLANCRGSLN